MSFKIKRRILTAFTVLLVIAVIFFHEFFFGTHAGLTAFIAIMLVFTVITLIWWRCPHCRTGLGRRVLWIKYCPRCGKELND